jgi:uncharacterized phage protein gp47/JayE
MVDYGPTAEGFRRKTEAEIVTSIGTEWRANISENLDFETASTVEANQLRPVAAELGLCWEVLEQCWNGLDAANATDASAVAIAAFAGASPRGPTQGYALVQAELEVGVYAVGDLVAAVAGEPDNEWTNSKGFEIFVEDTYDVDMVSTLTGTDARALAGTLNIVVSGTGFLSVNNAADATSGRDTETAEELTIRRRDELFGAGSATEGSLKEAIRDVPGVIDCDNVTNTSSLVVDGIPPRSHKPIIWDGSPHQADDDAIAQAIYDSQADGIRSYGPYFGTAVDEDGNPSIEMFDRATVQDVYVKITVDATTTDATIQTTLSNFVGQVMGKTLVVSQLSREVSKLDGVTDVVSLLIGTAPSPTASLNLVGNPATIYRLQTINITVIRA